MLPFTPFLLLVALFAVSAQAAPYVKTPFVLTPAVAFSLYSPPEPGSAEEAADFVELHRLQNTRTEAECAAAQVQAWYSPRTISGVSKGLLSEAEFLILEDFIKHLLDTGVVESGVLKAKYDRARPYITDPTLTPCVTKPKKNDRAFPSGHSLGGILSSNVLSQLFPERRVAFSIWGRQVGLNRLLGGVHHPSDVMAAWKLSEEIMRELPKHAGFRAMYADVEAKLAALKTQANCNQELGQ